MDTIFQRVSPYGGAIFRYKKTTAVRERVPWANFLRGIAAFCVVLCHATESVYAFTPSFFDGQPFASQLFAFASFAIGRTGVPLFFFLSGYFLLARRYDDRSCFSFWRKNLLPLLVTTEIWILFYNAFLSLYFQTPLQWWPLLHNVLFLEQVGMGHYWYMPVILGMYLFLPFAARALQAFRAKSFLIPAAAVFFGTFLLPVINILAAPENRVTYYFLFDFSWSGNGYGALIAFGYFVRRGCFRKIKSSLLALFAAVAFAATIALMFYAYRLGNGENLWYTWGTLILFTSCLCELFSRFENLGKSAFFQAAAKYSFGIFLVHFPVMMLLQKFLSPLHMLPADVLLLFSLTLFFSWTIVYMINKIPHAGKFFFLIK